MADEDWIAALPLEDLPESRATKVMLDGTAVLLFRSGERIFAIGNRCTHQGAPLDRGPVKVSGSEATVTCPAHGSMFRLRGWAGDARSRHPARARLRRADQRGRRGDPGPHLRLSRCAGAGRRPA